MRANDIRPTPVFLYLNAPLSGILILLKDSEKIDIASKKCYDISTLYFSHAAKGVGPMPKAKSRDDNKLSFGKTLRNNFFLLRIAWRIKPSRIVCDFLFHAVDSIFGYYYSIVFLGVLYSAVEKDLGFGAVLIFIAVTMALFLIFTCARRMVLEFLSC